MSLAMKGILDHSSSFHFTELTKGMSMRALVPIHPHLCPPFSCHTKPSSQDKEITQKVLQPSISRRVVTTVAMTSALLAKEAIFSKKIANAFELDFRLVAPDQTSEEAESVIRNHAQDLLSIKDLLESESWKELQKTLRKSSSNLKQDIYTIIQAKPGNQRAQLRKLYYTLFDNVTKLDYAARDGDASVVWQCYGNIVETLGNILSRI